MPTFGKVDEYNEGEDWSHYIERLNHFFEANDIESGDKKRSIFLVSVGAKTYKLIRSLVAPEDPKEKTYEDLAKLVQVHYKPKPSVIVERFKFNTRRQQPGETISMFLAELRRLSENCEFGATLEEMLRDRIVCGASDNKIQRRLLAEPKLTLKRALDLAIAIETSEKDVLDLQKNNAQEGGLVKKMEMIPRVLEKSSVVDAMGNTTQVSVVSRKLSAMHVAKLAISPELVEVKTRVETSRGNKPKEVDNTSLNQPITFRKKERMKKAMKKALQNILCICLAINALPHTKSTCLLTEHSQTWK